MRTVLAWVVFVSASVVAGCGGNSAQMMSSTDCGANAPKYADVTIFQKCTMCHSSKLSGSARRSAPMEINFDTYAAAEKNASQAVGDVKAGNMPPRGSGVTVTDAEKTQLELWEMCGAMQ
jgi:uncharacterized membrane protein